MNVLGKETHFWLLLFIVDWKWDCQSEGILLIVDYDKNKYF